MRRAAALVALLALSACFDFQARFEQCRDAGLCIDEVAPAQLAIERVTDLPTVRTGSVSTHEVLLVRNAGQRPSGLLAVTVTPTDGGASALSLAQGATACQGATLEPDATCTVELRFAPTATGDESVEVAVAADPGGRAAATVRGSVTAPAVVSVTPNAQNFLFVRVGDSSASVSFLVRNDGQGATGPMTVATLNATSFPIRSNTCAQTGLSPAEQCTVEVAFVADDPPRVVQSSLEVAWGSEAARADLSGEAIGPSALVFDDSALAFGDVDVGQTPTGTLTLRAADTNPTGALSVRLADGGSGDFQLAGGTCDGRPGVTPTDPCTIIVRYAPQAFGSDLGSVVVTGALAGLTAASISGRGLDLVQLDVATDGGNGYGTVTSLGADGGPDGLIACGASCAASRRRFSTVALRAAPATNATFRGWSGACASAGLDASCSLSLDVPQTQVTAAFERPYRLTVVTDAGHVVSTPTGIDCWGNCTTAFPADTVVTLAVDTVQDPFVAHIGWGDCDGGPCEWTATTQVVMDRDRQVPARFAPYNRVFVTRDTMRADRLYTMGVDQGQDRGILGWEGARNFCSTQAGLANLTGSYLPWVAASQRLPANLGMGSTYVRMDGRPIGPGAMPTWYPIRLDQFGNDVGRVLVATGTTLDGGLAAGNCDNWGAGSGGGTSAGVIHGWSSMVGADWTSVRNPDEPFVDCTTPVHLYCYEAMNPAWPTRQPVAPAGARRAFVLRRLVMGSESNAALDLACAGDAVDAGFSGTFRVLRSSPGASAESRFPGGVPGTSIHRGDGVEWARAERLFAADGGTFTALVAHARGDHPSEVTLPTYYSSTRVFTGADAPSSAATNADSCDGWTQVVATAKFGALTDSAYWFWDRVAPSQTTECGNMGLGTFPRRVYCLQQ